MLVVVLLAIVLVFRRDDEMWVLVGRIGVLLIFWGYQGLKYDETKEGVGFVTIDEEEIYIVRYWKRNHVLLLCSIAAAGVYVLQYVSPRPLITLAL